MFAARLLKGDSPCVLALLQATSLRCERRCPSPSVATVGSCPPETEVETWTYVPLAFDAPSAEDDGDPTDSTDLCAWTCRVQARLPPDVRHEASLCW